MYRLSKNEKKECVMMHLDCVTIRSETNMNTSYPVRLQVHVCRHRRFCYVALRSVGSFASEAE